MSWKVDVKHDLKVMKLNLWKMQAKIRNECKRITEQARSHTRDVALKKQTKKTTKEEEEQTKKKKEKTTKKEEEETKKKTKEKEKTKKEKEDEKEELRYQLLTFVIVLQSSYIGTVYDDVESEL